MLTCCYAMLTRDTSSSNMAAKKCTLLVVTFLMFLSLNSTDSLIRLGTEHTEGAENWKFLSRFCFLSKAGRLSFEFSYPKSYDLGPNGAQNIILYYDDQWPSVYMDSPNDPYLSCLQKEAILKPENNQVINLTTRYIWSGCVIEKRAFNGTFTDFYVCKGGRTFSSYRERWWYIVVDNCKSEKGLWLQYNLTMTNAKSGNVFFEHFSADEFYILQTDIAFLLAYALMIGQSIYVAYSLILRQLYHTTYKIYMASIMVEFISLCVQVAYWADYAITGLPKDGWKYIGRSLEFSSSTLFIVLLILMAKGFTITRGRISTGGNIKIVVFTCAYIALVVAMFIWEAVSFDPALVLYLYGSIPGFIFLALRLLAWIWFLYGIFFTLKKYPEKRPFYYPFLIIYTLWFWAAPIIAFVAISSIPKWTREKTVNGVTLLTIFLGHVVFLILTWPTLAGRNFPFHIRTTQIAALNTSNEPAGAYAPTEYYGNLSEGERRFVDIFTTDHSRGSQNRTVNIDSFPHAQEPNQQQTHYTS